MPPTSHHAPRARAPVRASRVHRACGRRSAAHGADWRPAARARRRDHGLSVGVPHARYAQRGADERRAVSDVVLGTHRTAARQRRARQATRPDPLLHRVRGCARKRPVKLAIERSGSASRRLPVVHHRRHGECRTPAPHRRAAPRRTARRDRDFDGRHAGLRMERPLSRPSPRASSPSSVRRSCRRTTSCCGAPSWASWIERWR